MEVPPPAAPTPRVLVIDVGGTHVKLWATGRRAPIRFESGRKLTPPAMVASVKRLTARWTYDAVSIGYPGAVLHGHPIREPYHLGTGWVGFNFRRALGHRTKLVNDAAMQALGSYRGGRMLFLGLGTGLGSAMIVDGKLEPFELAHLPYKKGRTFEEYVGDRGLQRLGKKKWRRHVADAIRQLRRALQPEYVVVGGGNARKLKQIPARTFLGTNENAFVGGVRLWDPAYGTSKVSPPKGKRKMSPRSAKPA